MSVTDEKLRPSNLPSNGQRRAFRVADEVAIYPNLWKPSLQGREEQFDEWRYLAMQILHDAKATFRVMAIYDRLFDWDSREIVASDEEIAEEAGRCDKKTVSREISTHKKLGIICVDQQWREKYGKHVKTRVIRLSLPKNMPKKVHVR